MYCTSCIIVLTRRSLLLLLLIFFFLKSCSPSCHEGFTVLRCVSKLLFKWLISCCFCFKGRLLNEIRAVTRRQSSAVTCVTTDVDCKYVISGDASKLIVVHFLLFPSHLFPFFPFLSLPRTSLPSPFLRFPSFLDSILPIFILSDFLSYFLA